MARPSPQSGISFDKLLQERNQYLQWLARLGATEDTTPEAVREKVRADYEVRLQAVVDQLRQHASGITDQIIQKRAALQEIAARQQKAQEMMAEAELRHAVGEYDEADWQQVRADNHRQLVSAREELNRVTEEVGRLVEVQQLLGATPPPEAEPAPAAAKPRFPAPAQTNALARTPEPADKTAAKPRDAPPARTVWVPNSKGETTKPGALDELSFLRSMADEQDEATVPAGSGSRRVSGGVAKPSDLETTVVDRQPDDPPEPKAGGKPELKQDDPTEARTLKCSDCGTMNRPTEWYCERCGAELAAL